MKEPRRSLRPGLNHSAAGGSLEWLSRYGPVCRWSRSVRNSVKARRIASLHVIELGFAEKHVVRPIPGAMVNHLGARSSPVEPAREHDA